MWESMVIRQTAMATAPNIKTHAIPQSLQVERGPEAVVEHLEKELPKASWRRPGLLRKRNVHMRVGGLDKCVC